MPDLSFNTVLFASLGAGFALAFFAGEARVRKLAAGALVGYLVAIQLGEFVLAQLGKVSFIPELSLGTVQIILFAFITLSFNLGRAHQVEGRPRVNVESIVVAVITATFIFTSVLGFLGEETRSGLMNDYNLAAMLYEWRLLLLGLTAGGLILLEVMGANTKKPR
jgi:hypothetical protein